MTLPIELDGYVTNATGSFPYQPIGPIDFSEVNFVKTCQTDYYYNESSTPAQLLSQVTQCNNQFGTFWTLIGLTALFVAGVTWWAYYFWRKRK